MRVNKKNLGKENILKRKFKRSILKSGTYKEVCSVKTLLIHEYYSLKNVLLCVSSKASFFADVAAAYLMLQAS